MRTPRSRIVSCLRLLFLKSVERGEAIKRDKYTCQKCYVKQSKKKGFEQKVEVHHKKGINVWDEVVDLIYKDLLCDPDGLVTLCPECHKEIDS